MGVVKSIKQPFGVVCTKQTTVTGNLLQNLSNSTKTRPKTLMKLEGRAEKAAKIRKVAAKVDNFFYIG